MGTQNTGPSVGVSYNFRGCTRLCGQRSTRWRSGQDPPADAAEAGGVGSSPGSGRSSGGGHGHLLQYFCLGNPVDRGAWQATVHRVTKSETQLEYTRTHAHTYTVNQQFLDRKHSKELFSRSEILSISNYSPFLTQHTKNLKKKQLFGHRKVAQWRRVWWSGPRALSLYLRTHQSGVMFVDRL